MKTLIEKLTPIQTLSAIIIGLVTGAFGLIYAYWQFSDQLAERQRVERERENEEQANATAIMVRAMWVNDLKALKDSINADHSRLMQSNYRKDSLLLIVIPRMLDQVRESTNTVKRIEAKMETAQKDDVNPIWEYLKEKEARDSIASRDAAIMRELRRINLLLMHRAKFESNSNNAGQLE